MFKKIKEFFTGKPAVETTPNPILDVAINNVVETTKSTQSNVVEKAETQTITISSTPLSPTKATKSTTWQNNKPPGPTKKKPVQQKSVPAKTTKKIKPAPTTK
jgi:hypothetical protein